MAQKNELSEKEMEELFFKLFDEYLNKRGISGPMEYSPMMGMMPGMNLGGDMYGNMGNRDIIDLFMQMNGNPIQDNGRSLQYGNRGPALTITTQYQFNLGDMDTKAYAGLGDLLADTGAYQTSNIANYVMDALAKNYKDGKAAKDKGYVRQPVAQTPRGYDSVRKGYTPSGKSKGSSGYSGKSSGASYGSGK